MFSITIYLVTVHGAEFGDFLFCNPFSSVWKNKKTKNSISYRQTRVRIYRPPPFPRKIRTCEMNGQNDTGEKSYKNIYYAYNRRIFIMDYFY